MSFGTMEERTEGMKRQAQELIEQAYNRGFKAGYEVGFEECDEQNQQLIIKGMDMAWEAARKIMNMPEDGGLSDITLINLFKGCSYVDIVNNYSASEAIEKLKAYEEQKEKVEKEDNEIKVGDVIRDGDVEAVVTWCNGKDWNGFLFNFEGEDVGEVGQVYYCMSCNGWKKTGRHFPEIAEVLKKMKEGE